MTSREPAIILSERHCGRNLLSEERSLPENIKPREGKQSTDKPFRDRVLVKF